MLIFFVQFVFCLSPERLRGFIHIFYTGRQTAAVGFVARTVCSGRLKKMFAAVVRMF